LCSINLNILIIKLLDLYKKFILYNICFIFAVSLAFYFDFSLFNTNFFNLIEGDINNEATQSEADNKNC
jgi:hypothetical protein